jgi:hypothetical protein
MRMPDLPRTDAVNRDLQRQQCQAHAPGRLARVRKLDNEGISPVEKGTSAHSRVASDFDTIPT